jgi:hypothetical protein
MKPSILQARSEIGSSDELDEYGVWVKSEPKDWACEADGFDLDDMDDFSSDRVAKKPLACADDFNALYDVDPIHGDVPDPEFIAESDTVFPGPEAVQNETRQTQLLQTIANELVAIKGELESLKHKFAGAELGEDGNKPHGGFFDDDDTDDAIILTGEELADLDTGLDGAAAEGDSDDGTVVVEESLAPPADETLDAGEMDAMLTNADVEAEEAAASDVEVEASLELDGGSEGAADDGGDDDDDTLSSSDLENMFSNADLVEDTPPPEEEAASAPEFDPVMESGDIDAGIALEPEDAGAPDGAPDGVEEMAEVEAIEEFVADAEPADTENFANVTIELEDEEKQDETDPFSELENSLGEAEEEIIIQPEMQTEEAEAPVPEQEGVQEVSIESGWSNGPEEEEGVNFTLEDFSAAASEQPAIQTEMLDELPDFPDLGEEAAEAPDDFAGLDLPGEEAPEAPDDLAGLDGLGEEAPPAEAADDFAGLDGHGEEAADD